MGFGEGIRSNLSRAGSKREQAKRKTDSEVDISRLQCELDEALAHRDLAFQQRNKVLAKIPMFVPLNFCFV